MEFDMGKVAKTFLRIFLITFLLIGHIYAQEEIWNTKYYIGTILGENDSPVVILNLAILFLEKWALSHGLRLADALIAATAHRQSKALATSNIKHYRFIKEIQLIEFYPDN